ncbi:catalase family peroxidase [Alsobacter sp. KACC 23698]|uniref:Catalase-related peroxidase n=1 Tax=Alsobacter sp. KACC 23698 TaxID=3149229 RepID=A0AAU7JL79_9HYPH
MHDPRWRTTLTIVLSAMALSNAAGGTAMAETDQSDLPAQLVRDFHGAFGDRHARAVHAKGIFFEGSFQPSVEAPRLSTASLFTGRRPVTVRFSDFTGLPDIPDTSGDANPRGLAIKFDLPGGGTYDIVSHSFNGFPVATAAEFSTLLQALPKSGPDAPKPTPLDTFFASHPRALAFFTTQKPPPESFATSAYFGVNAFYFTNAAGQKLPVRYRFVPGAGERYLTADAVKASSANFLMDEIGPRVATHPVTFTWLAQVGDPGDKIDDPSLAWPESRRQVTLGVITIDKAVPNTPERDRALLFLPGDVPSGIGIADPMVEVRNAAYPVSFGERQ